MAGMTKHEGKKTVLITGCSDSGLGAALALAFHATGQYRVIATARDISKLKQCIDAGIETISLDVTSPVSISECVKEVSRLTNGTLNVLVNNAGAGYCMPVADIALDEMRKCFEVNVFSIISVTQAFLPLLLKAKSNPKTSGSGATIINNNSVSSISSVPFQGPYAASKAASANLTDTMRLELQPFGITVISLVTGLVRTNFFQNQASNSTTKLPPGSIYSVAQESVERAMAGHELMAQGMDASAWAEQVVKKLNLWESTAPPLQIWKGNFVNDVWFGSFFSLTWLDSLRKKVGGIDEVERKVKEVKFRST